MAKKDTKAESDTQKINAEGLSGLPPDTMPPKAVSQVKARLKEKPRKRGENSKEDK